MIVWLSRLLLKPYMGWALLGASALAIGGAFSGGYWLAATVKGATIARMQRDEATGITNSLNLSLDTTHRLAAMASAVSLQLAADTGRVSYMTFTITKEIPRYVTPEIDARYPVPCAVVRMRDAAILQADAAGLAAAACASDDAASPISASALSAEDVGLVGKYYASELNRAALADYITRLTKIWNDYRASAAAGAASLPQPEGVK